MKKVSIIAIVVLVAVGIGGGLAFSKSYKKKGKSKKKTYPAAQSASPKATSSPVLPGLDVSLPTLPQPTQPSLFPDEPGADVPLRIVVTVNVTDKGYAPQNVSVKRGTQVNFVNKSSNPVQTASALHPTHTAYPGTDIKKCSQGQTAPMFDACRGIPTGETWSFVFEQPGTWRYHDHLKPSVYGSVTVQ